MSAYTSQLLSTSRLIMRTLCHFVFVLSIILISLSCQAGERSEWESVLSKAKKRAPSSALVLMRERYAALPAGAEKLYIASLIYDFMAQKNKRYYSSQSSIHSEYQQLENEFVNSLIAEQQREYDIAEQGYLNLYQYMKAKAENDGELLFEYHLCRLYNQKGQYFKSQFYCEQLSQRLTSEQNPLVASYRAWTVIAKNQEFIGNYQSALHNYKRVLDKLPESEDPSFYYNDIGLLFCTIGQYDKALEYLYRALTLQVESNTRLGVAKIEHSLGDVYFHMQDFEKSIVHFNKARLILSDDGNVKALAYAHLGLGRSYTEIGEFHHGINYLLKSLNYAIEHNNTALKIEVYLALSGSYLAKKYYKQAHYYAMKAKILAEQTKNLKTTTLALRQLAIVSDHSQNYRQALYYYRNYVDNEIEIRNSEHRKAFEALDLSKQQLEQKLMRSNLSHKNDDLTTQVNQLNFQRYLLLAVLSVFFIATCVILRQYYKLKNHIGVDCLTSALHRPEFIEKLKTQNPSNNEDNKNLIILFDIDNLKSINDSYGYEIGNKILKNISKVIEDSIKNSGFWGRLSGGKFAVVMNNVDPFETQFYVETIHKDLTLIPHESSNNSLVFTSINASYLSVSWEMNDFNQLYPILDRALNQSKKLGQNVIVNASQ